MVVLGWEWLDLDYHEDKAFSNTVGQDSFLLAGRKILQMLLKQIRLIRKKGKNKTNKKTQQLEVPSLNVQKV